MSLLLELRHEDEGSLSAGYDFALRIDAPLFALSMLLCFAVAADLALICCTADSFTKEEIMTGFD